MYIIQLGLVTVCLVSNIYYTTSDGEQR